MVQDDMQGEKSQGQGAVRYFKMQLVNQWVTQPIPWTTYKSKHQFYAKKMRNLNKSERKLRELRDCI